jgi:hypothetical protein
MGLVEEGGPVHFSSPNPPLLDIWVGFGGKEVAMLPPPSMIMCMNGVEVGGGMT